MKLYKVEYLSSCTVNKRLTNPMIPWIIAEIKKNNYHKKVSVIFLCMNINVNVITYYVPNLACIMC